MDVQAHVTAMQGKVLAALLHPHRHAWKQFMRANLERKAPGVGVRVLLQQHSSGQAAAAHRRQLNPRHAAHVAAFRELGLHRRIPHGSMTVQQIHLEPVLGNHSVANAVTGGLFGSLLSLPSTVQPRSRGVTLGQVVARGLSFQPAVDELVLPQEWQHTLQGIAQQQPQPQTLQQKSQWEVDAQGRWVWQGMEDQEQWYKVQPDGSLRRLNAGGGACSLLCGVRPPWAARAVSRSSHSHQGGRQGASRGLQSGGPVA